MGHVDRNARGARLRAARKNAKLSAGQVADRVGYSESGVRALENGQNDLKPDAAELFAAVLGVSAAWLLTGEDVNRPRVPLTRIIGRVGANPDGDLVMTTADEQFDFAPVPPGGSTASVALEVDGHSMRGFAEDGSLIYFEDQKTPPTADMIGYPVVVETEDGRVLVKRLLRGSRTGLYDLESSNGPTITDVRLRWAAEITAIIPTRHARRIIRRNGEAVWVAPSSRQ